MKLDNFLKKLISFLFPAMFFLVPLFFTSVNSELFEFNKIILLYGFATLIVGIWTARMILARQIIFKRTFLDIPLALFLASQIASTVFSIDRHTSLFGYYSRFNGGLLSTITYLLLYWAFVSNCEIKDVYRSIKFSLISAAIISIYGILEHFGHSFSCLMFTGKFDVSCWVQKVQERVFATLGQPNWLAAYLTILLPLTWFLVLKSKIKNQRSKPNSKLQNLFYYLLFTIYFSCLLFTQSRSGFLGFLLSFGVFGVLSFRLSLSDPELAEGESKGHGGIPSFLKPFLFLIFDICILIFFFGSPFPQINKYLSYKSLVAPPSQTPITYNLSPITSSEDGGISASSDIRKIVWQGAFAIFKHYPVFGSGVETFAYSYYNFRPMEHNLVSEWDFLYNKAHNEYLNYLSTTGIFGLVTYLLLIGSFIFFNIKNLKAESEERKTLVENLKLDKSKFLALNFSSSLLVLRFSLFSGWLSLLVTNFFGFSVVVTSLYFYLIPAFITVLSSPSIPYTLTPKPSSKSLNPYIPKSLLIVPLLAISYSLFAIFNMWHSDLFYSQGLKQSKKGQYYEAYQNFFQAIKITPNEPIFLNEISAAASLAYNLNQNDASTAAELTQSAIDYSDKARKISPANLNILKTRVKVFYTLSSIKSDYLTEAVAAIKEAIKLAPTDPKLVYNLGLLYGKQLQTQLAVETVEKAVEMKPNYVDARNALSIFYEDLGQKEKALDQLQTLIKLAPENKTEFDKRIKNLKE